MTDNHPERFSDEQAKAILARAIEIDASRSLTTTDDLRAIAAELGVSQASLDAAVDEQVTSMQAHRIASSRRTATVITTIGAPVGVAAGLLVTSGAILPALGLMTAGLALSGGLVVFQGSTGSLRSFHLKNLALWSSVFAGSVAGVALLGSGSGLLIAAGWCVRSWIASSILGSAAVVAVRRSHRSDASDPGAGASEAPTSAGRRRWLTIVRRIAERLLHPLRFGVIRTFRAPGGA